MQAALVELPKQDVEVVELDVLGAERVWEFYGSTEGQFTACRGDEWLERPGTVGRARPNRRLDVDADPAAAADAADPAAGSR